MSDYSQVTNFTAKDSLSSGDPEKIILGADVDGEFSAISTAIATKYDSTDIASTVEAQGLSVNTKLITPSGLNDVLIENAGVLGDIQALTDPNADRILFWDDSDGATEWLTVGDGLEISTNTLQLPAALAGAGLTLSSGVLAVGGGSGITANADDVALTDVAAGAAQPVVITSGTFTFDLSSITTMSVEDVNVAQDGVVMSDNGTIKVLPLDEGGVDVIEVSDAAQTFALADANTYQVLTSISADRDWTIPPNSSTAFKIGTCIMVMDRDGDGTFALDVLGGAGVTITSSVLSAAAGSSRHKIIDGGTALFIKIATDEWAAVGDIADGN